MACTNWVRRTLTNDQLKNLVKHLGDYESTEGRPDNFGRDVAYDSDVTGSDSNDLSIINTYYSEAFPESSAGVGGLIRSPFSNQTTIFSTKETHSASPNNPNNQTDCHRPEPLFFGWLLGCIHRPIQ